MDSIDIDLQRVDACVEYIRRTLNADFRKYLKTIGRQNPQHVVLMFDEEPVSSLVIQVRRRRTTAPILIVIPTEGAPFGYRFMWAVTAADHETAPSIDVPPTASVGMLYSALHPCGEYVPSEWSQPVRFERVPA